MDLTRFSPGLKAEAVVGQDFSPAGLLHGESVRVVVDVGVVVCYVLHPASEVLVSISSMLYKQLLRAQIPNGQKKTYGLTVFLHFQDLHV